MGIYTVNASSQRLLCLFKKRSQFFLSFILYLNIFVSFKTIRYYKTCNLLFHTMLSSATFLRFTKQHLPLTCTKKMDGSTITAITFPYILTDKERYNPLDYFRMVMIEELRFFLLTWKTLLVIKTLCKMMRNIENQGLWIAKKKRLKST